MTSAQTASVIETPRFIELLQSYTYKDSFKTWMSGFTPQEHEQRLLKMLLFYPNGDSTRSCKVMDVDIGDGKHIHEFEIENTTEPKEKGKRPDVVLVHGYGTALGVFIRNFDGLSQFPGIRLHAIDLLGYGLSSRPKFPNSGILRSYPFRKAKETREDVDQAIDFFVNSMEAWRKKRKLDKIILVSHSLGGYLSSFYAMRYPEHVQKLILVSPVGVERSIYEFGREDSPSTPSSEEPPSISSASHSPSTSASPSLRLEKDRTNTQAVELGPDISAEFRENQGVNNTDQISPQSSSSFHIPNESGYVEKVPNLPALAKIVWNMNVSPFAILRNVGPLGPKVCANWSFRRFAHCGTPTQVLAFHEYFYSTFNSKGSGEYAITRILAPGALARVPLLAQLPQSIKCDTLWLYGDNDWMSKEAGRIIVNKINQDSSYKAEFKVINNAGHHIYLDNPEDFNREILRVVDSL